jgi:threonine synthase
MFNGYRCTQCGELYHPDKPVYLCPQDGAVLDVTYDWGQLEPEQIQKSDERSMWRYLPLLPVADPGLQATPLRRAGWTPIYDLPVLAQELSIRQLWVKDEGANPTASLKDRASALVVARAAEIGASVTVTASTGNAGAALAGMAAAAKTSAVIFAPKTALPAKVAQLLVYGARVFLIKGTYDDAVHLSQEAAEEFGWYCRNTGYNPFTIEGKKTAAFEIWEQLIANGRAPDAVFVPVGDGNIISGIHKGLRELQELGWLEQVPQLYGVQAEGAASIANAFLSHSETIDAVKANTLADGIAVDLPNDGQRALRAATETGGAYLKVSDTEILSAVQRLGLAGIFAEPAGAAAFAGLRKAVAQGQITADQRVLVLNTGSGLKDIGAALRAMGQAPVIDASIPALKRAMEVID